MVPYRGTIKNLVRKASNNAVATICPPLFEIGLADLPNQGKAAVLPVFPAMATPAKKIQLILQFPQSILVKGVSTLIFNHDFWLDFSQTKITSSQRATIFMPFQIDGPQHGK